MEDPNSTLLPYILKMLSEKPGMCESFDHLCSEIETQLKQERLFQHLDMREALQRAINIAESIGILTITQEDVRVPFQFHSRKGKAPVILQALKELKGTDALPVKAEASATNTRCGCVSPRPASSAARMPANGTGDGHTVARSAKKRASKSTAKDPILRTFSASTPCQKSLLAMAQASNVSVGRQMAARPRPFVAKLPKVMVPSKWCSACNRHKRRTARVRRVRRVNRARRSRRGRRRTAVRRR